MKKKHLKLTAQKMLTALCTWAKRLRAASSSRCSAGREPLPAALWRTDYPRWRVRVDWPTARNTPPTHPQPRNTFREERLSRRPRDDQVACVHRRRGAHPHTLLSLAKVRRRETKKPKSLMGNLCHVTI